ncbi:hypothetical protein [Terribacillus saccharophilus]|jgi:two-component system, LytTR family, sensor histidine kinase LytS|uniref:Uncharacterized protein n=1 Tax=Terribacillus saccharophilus TaxID=361277 RepID=A0ABX4GW23_9BACI|nr:hypothetical protein [Terribacillus saccharophilus]PAD34746.1 hypothetical protein CHH56_13240 [Terribacillus saccharophilus]PAD95494.1 hypothetical protein CHH50_13475 [Terribacillus saccharophilus]PAD99072.1 hypothetical protein CHH48_14370 [Terribacillus saccharophilus]
MLSLVPLMIERVGIILITVFLFSQLKAFRRLILHSHSLKENLLLLLIFGFKVPVSRTYVREVKERFRL